MNKKLSLFFLTALLAVMGAKADVPFPESSEYYSEPAEGTYYLYNVDQSKFMGNTDLIDIPMEITLEAVGDGRFYLTPANGGYFKIGKAGSQYLWNNSKGSTSVFKWEFTQDGTKTYKLGITIEEDTWTEAGYEFTTGASYYLNSKWDITKNDENTPNNWVLITPDNYRAYIATLKANAIPSTYYSALPTEADETITGYLYDVVNQKFVETRTWGTKGSNTPELTVTITKYSTGYLISGTNDNQYLKYGEAKEGNVWNNGGKDASESLWIASKEDGDETNTYIFKNSTGAGSNDTGRYLYSRGTTSTNVANANFASASYSQWAIITIASYKKARMIEANGDATAIISEPSFATAGNWTGGRVLTVNLYRGAGNDYENTDANNATFTQTLTNMPAGSYKLVAAVRGAEGTTAQAVLGGSAGDVITNHEFKASNQFNTNGVLMPKSNLGGFNYANYALGWQWATATKTLNADGDLTIEFNMNGTGFRGVADVHLYYMSDGINDYAVEYTPDVDAANHAVTCDLTVTNPNEIFTSTGDAITTISGEPLNNNLVGSTIANLVLYDGYAYEAPAGSYAATSATLYRSLPADTWCTLVVPFVPTTELTEKVPTSLTASTLTFGDAEAANDKPMLVKSTSAITSITGTRANSTTGALTAGEGATMTGIYDAIANLNTEHSGCYVVARKNGEDNLYSVNSAVSLNPFRAYFTIPTISSARISMNFDEETTGISLNEVEGLNENADIKDGKFFENGKIVIMKNGVKYSVNGQIVK